MEKKCKHCATLIAKEARVCPQCGKRQRMSFVVKVLLIVCGFIVVCVIMGGIIGNQAIKSTAPETLTNKGRTVRAAHRDWPVDICNYVAKRQIVEGMTREQVRAAWGRPTHITKEEAAGASQEVWLYGALYNGSRCIFAGDTLVSFVNISSR
jgi:hypothetical protein